MDYKITNTEIGHKVLADFFEDPEAWVQNLVNIEVAKRSRSLMLKKTAEDVANPEVSNITADEDTILNSVFDADGYKTVAEKRAKPSSQEAT